MNSTPPLEAPRRKKRSAEQPPVWVIYLFLLGPVTLLVLFGYIPAFSAIYHAFTRWDVGGESSFTGLENFRELLTDPVFHKSLVNMAKLGGFMLTAFLCVPFVVAEMIYHLKSERWNYFCRVLVVLPMVVPGVVLFMIWGYIYSDAGFLTEFLYLIGKPEWIRGWLSDPDTALWAVAFVGFPFASGFHILIYYAGLANIPNDVLEAAQIDGLGSLGRIFRIHLPLILQQLKILIVITAIMAVNGFEVIYLLTRDGGPGYETMVPGLYMYLNGFVYQRMGYACAIGLALLVFLLVFTLTINRIWRDNS